MSPLVVCVYRCVGSRHWFTPVSRPAGPQMRLIQKHVVEQNLDPMSGQADFSHRVIQVAPVLRIFLVVRDDREDGDRSRRPA